eukprot:m51a1_g9421 putative tyrosyl-trna synthetase (580) ;mRNA; r:369834-373843
MSLHGFVVFVGIDPRFSVIADGVEVSPAPGRAFGGFREVPPGEHRLIVAPRGPTTHFTLKPGGVAVFKLDDDRLIEENGREHYEAARIAITGTSWKNFVPFPSAEEARARMGPSDRSEDACESSWRARPDEEDHRCERVTAWDIHKLEMLFEDLREDPGSQTLREYYLDMVRLQLRRGQVDSKVHLLAGLGKAITRHLEMMPELASAPGPGKTLLATLLVSRHSSLLSMSGDRPLYRQQFDPVALAARPLRLTNANKRVLYAMTGLRPSDPDPPPLTFSRWPPARLPRSPIAPRGTARVVTAPFDYAPAGAPHERHWHVNFADRRLFGFYGGPLFAQDEFQVGEHPALAHLREELAARGGAAEPLTSANDGNETPCLVADVQRRAAIDYKLYGSRFAQASEAELREAVHLGQPPYSLSNIVAMEAPKFGQGEYSTSQIGRIVSTAYTGFRAAVAESTALAPRSPGAPPRVVVHTGAWGCGAYGGNVELMAAAQFAAARAAGVDEVVFHAIDDAVAAVAQRSLCYVEKLLSESAKVRLQDVVKHIHERKSKEPLPVLPLRFKRSSAPSAMDEDQAPDDYE